MFEPYERWLWKMHYCQNKGISPAQTWAWDMADNEYINQFSPCEEVECLSCGEPSYGAEGQKESECFECSVRRSGLPV